MSETATAREDLIASAPFWRRRLSRLDDVGKLARMVYGTELVGWSFRDLGDWAGRSMTVEAHEREELCAGVRKAQLEYARAMELRAMEPQRGGGLQTQLERVGLLPIHKLAKRVGVRRGVMKLWLSEHHVQVIDVYGKLYVRSEDAASIERVFRGAQGGGA